MSDRNTPDTENGAIKDPAEWTTGEEPMTGAQDSYVHTLARKAGEEVPDEMTKAEASMKIDELREKTGVAALGLSVLLFTYAAAGGTAGVMWLTDLAGKLVAGRRRASRSSRRGASNCSSHRSRWWAGCWRSVTSPPRATPIVGTTPKTWGGRRSP